jgi:hypothetical protein
MAGPLDELVKRIVRRAESFKEEHGLEEVEVSVELVDGALHRLVSLSAEPGFGFVSLRPHSTDGDPQEIIVPVGALREIRLGAPGPEHAFGFAGPAAADG